MPKVLSRIVALFLAPCLIADHASAVTLFQQHVNLMFQAAPRWQGAFEEQALEEALTQITNALDIPARVRSIQESTPLTRTEVVATHQIPPSNRDRLLINLLHNRGFAQPQPPHNLTWDHSAFRSLLSPNIQRLSDEANDTEGFSDPPLLSLLTAGLLILQTLGSQQVHPEAYREWQNAIDTYNDTHKPEMSMTSLLSAGMSAYYHPTDDRDYFSLLDNAKNLPNELRDRFIPFQIAQIAFHPAAEEFDVRALEHLLPLAFERLKETSDVTIQRRYQAAIALVVCNSGYRNQTTKGVMNLFDAEPSVYLWFERLRQWEIKHKFRLSNIDIFMGTLWIYREGRIAEEDFLKVAEQAMQIDGQLPQDLHAFEDLSRGNLFSHSLRENEAELDENVASFLGRQTNPSSTVIRIISKTPFDASDDEADQLMQQYIDGTLSSESGDNNVIRASVSKSLAGIEHLPSKELHRGQFISAKIIGHHLIFKRTNPQYILKQTISSVHLAMERLGGLAADFHILKDSESELELVQQEGEVLSQMLRRLEAEGKFDEIRSLVKKLSNLNQDIFRRGLFNLDDRPQNYVVINGEVKLADLGSLIRIDEHLEKWKSGKDLRSLSDFSRYTIPLILDNALERDVKRILDNHGLTNEKLLRTIELFFNHPDDLMPVRFIPAESVPTVRRALSELLKQKFQSIESQNSGHEALHGSASSNYSGHQPEHNIFQAMRTAGLTFEQMTGTFLYGFSTEGTFSASSRNPTSQGSFGEPFMSTLIHLRYRQLISLETMEAVLQTVRMIESGEIAHSISTLRSSPLDVLRSLPLNANETHSIAHAIKHAA